MPLAAVDELSDASGGGQVDPEVTSKKSKPAGKPKNAKPKEPEVPEVLKPAAKPKGGAKSGAKKKPAAAAKAVLKRPAGAQDETTPTVLKANKYIYRAEQKYGIKLNGSEKLTALPSRNF